MAYPIDDQNAIPGRPIPSILENLRVINVTRSIGGPSEMPKILQILSHDNNNIVEVAEFLKTPDEIRIYINGGITSKDIDSLENIGFKIESIIVAEEKGFCLALKRISTQ